MQQHGTDRGGGREKGQAVWPGTGGKAVCEAVCGWTRRRRRTKRSRCDERPEGPVRREKEDSEQAESRAREDRSYSGWRSRACSR
jgi:hypothetical protein